MKENWKKNLKKDASPLRLMTITIVSIFASEALVMLLLSFLQPSSMLLEAFVDSILLSILSAPLLYILLFRPMIIHIAHRTKAEAKLVKSNEILRAEIIERKRAEEELRKLSHAIKQSPVSIVITDTKGDIEYVNPKFTELTGYTHEEAIGQNPRVLGSGEHTPEFYKQLWDTITSGKEWKGEFHNREKTGSSTGKTRPSHRSLTKRGRSRITSP